MGKIGRILVTLFFTAVFGVLAAISWNGWTADGRSSNKIIDMLSHLQRWLMENAGPNLTAGLFACAAIFFLWAGLFADRNKAEA